jgi:Spy/CpxP family protein refolding chaperone
MTRFIRPLAAVAAFTLTLGGIAAVAGPAPALAQAGPPPAGSSVPPAGGQRGQRFGQMLLGLGLSDAQKGQIRSIMAKARAQNQSVTDPQVRRTNMRAAYANVRNVLTPAQQKKLDGEMQTARAQRQAANHS